MRIHANMLIRLDYKFSYTILTLFIFSIYVHVSSQLTPVFVCSFVYLLPMNLGYAANGFSKGTFV
jgi:hypothetical protein